MIRKLERGSSFSRPLLGVSGGFKLVRDNSLDVVCRSEVELRLKQGFHFTPVHGSWLNMVEIEFNALCGQRLDRRIPDAETLRGEVEAWVERRNTADADVDWQFTTADARVKLHRLYPQNDD